MNLQNPDISHDDSLTKADCLMVTVGVDEETLYSKSTALQVRIQLYNGTIPNERCITSYFLPQSWLLGYELSDTIMVFTADTVYFLSSKKKIEFLRQIENPKEKTGDEPTVKLLVRDKVSRILYNC